MTGSPEQVAELVRLPVPLPCRLPTHAESLTDHLPGGARFPSGRDEIDDLTVLDGPPLKGEAQCVEALFIGSSRAHRRSDRPVEGHATRDGAFHQTGADEAGDGTTGAFPGRVELSGNHAEADPTAVRAAGSEVGQGGGLLSGHVSSIPDVSRVPDALNDGSQEGRTDDQ